MPSSTTTTTTITRKSPFASSSPQKKQKMSLTQTYFLAHTARAKLSKEASRGDHNLRLLVGHANLLDGLMLDLVEAERSQEALFNSAARQSHITWSSEEPTRHQPTIIEDFEEDEEDSDSDSDYESDDEPTTFAAPIITTSEVEEDDEDDQETDDEEDYEHLALVRSPSRSSPPELLHESDSEDDESMPPSPPDTPMNFPSLPSNKKSTSASIQESFDEEGFYLPTRSAAVAVY